MNRLDQEVDNRLEESYRRYWAPVIVDFTAWVLRAAGRRGIFRLYFLSRDGYPMYLAARELTKEDRIWDLRYLRVSRMALRIPEMAEYREEYLDHIFLCGIDVTMRKILQRGGLEEQEMADICHMLHFNRSMDEILDRQEILAWKAVAEARKQELYPYFQRHGQAALAAARGYLLQEGLGDRERFAIVDSGWVGTTQRSLERLLGRDLYRPLEGYYFGLYEIPAEMDPLRYHTYYFGPKEDIRRKAHFSNCLFEAVCSEPAGMTLGYEWNGQTYEAVLSEQSNPNGAFLQRVLSVLIQYASGYTGDGSGRETSEQLLTELMRRPDREMTQMYGNLLFSDDIMEEGRLQPVAAMLSYADICELRLGYKLLHLLGFRRNHVIHESGWIYGSIVRCGRNVGMSLAAAEWYQRVLYWRKGLGK